MILQNTRNIFKKAIRCGGTTIFTFQAQPGMFGYYYYQLQVYGRQNKPCFNCGNEIIKFQLSRRGTYVCLKCQPLAYDDSKIRLNS